MPVNRIDTAFEAIRGRQSRAFIPFLTAGDPDLTSTERMIMAAEEAGADIIELGFPFSDPVADGPTIQASYTRVLRKGQKTEDVFRMVGSLREKSDIPIVAMISYSLVFKMGVERFIQRSREVGIDGATIPDLPIEEMKDTLKSARANDFHVICFVTPATPYERRKKVVETAAGFIYYIAVRGITGERGDIPPDLEKNLTELRQMTEVPVAVGFGISTPDHARSVARVSDGVIVGSAIVRRIHAAVERGDDPVEDVRAFIAQMSNAVKGEMSC